MVNVFEYLMGQGVGVFVIVLGVCQVGVDQGDFVLQVEGVFGIWV